MLFRLRQRTSDRSLAGSPACRCRSSSRQSSAHTSSGRPPPAGGTPRRRPARHEQRVREQHPRGASDGCGRCRPACRIGREAFRRQPARAARHDAPSGLRGSERPCPSRRRRRAFRMLSHLGIEVVRGAFAAELRSATSARSGPAARAQRICERSPQRLSTHASVPRGHLGRLMQQRISYRPGLEHHPLALALVPSPRT